MVPQTSSNDTFTSEANKRIAAAVSKSYKPYFYDSSGNYASINLDPEIIRQLSITSDTELTQEIVTTPEGKAILLRRRTPEQ